MAAHSRRALQAAGAACAFAAALALPGAMREAAAQTPDCSKSPDERTMLACHQAQVRRQDAQITALLKKFTEMNDDEPAMKRLITASQRAWVNYRAAECKMRTFESSTGSAAATYEQICFETLNAERIRDLQERVDNP